MASYTKRFKLKLVKHLLSGPKGGRILAREFNVPYSMIYRWAARYQQHGEAGLMAATGRYDDAFRLKVLRRMWRDELSYTRTAVLFGIGNATSVRRWEQQYHARHEGAQAPAYERPQMPKKPPPITKPDNEMTRDELLDEVKFLRAQADFLKNFNALVQEKQAASLEKKRKSSKD